MVLNVNMEHHGLEKIKRKERERKRKKRTREKEIMAFVIMF